MFRRQLILIFIVKNVKQEITDKKLLNRLFPLVAFPIALIETYSCIFTITLGAAACSNFNVSSSFFVKTPWHAVEVVGSFEKERHRLLSFRELLTHKKREGSEIRHKLSTSSIRLLLTLKKDSFVAEKSLRHHVASHEDIIFAYSIALPFVVGGT